MASMWTEKETSYDFLGNAFFTTVMRHSIMAAYLTEPEEMSTVIPATLVRLQLPTWPK